MENKKVKDAVEVILKEIGEDLNREGIKQTPKRVDRLYHNLFYRYRKTLKVMSEDERNGENFDKNIIPITTFKSKKYQEMLIREVNFHSTCEHHMVVFPFTAYVAIIPDEKIIGLNKIDAVVKYFASGLQIQERLTEEIANWLQKELLPKGVMVLIFGKHYCAILQGDSGEFVTNYLTGEFLNPKHGSPREEALSIITHMRQKEIVG